MNQINYSNLMKKSCKDFSNVDFTFYVFRKNEMPQNKRGCICLYDLDRAVGSTK